MTFDAQRRTLLEDSFRAAVRAADAATLFDAVELPQARRTVVVGGGKAAAAMAAALEGRFPERTMEGVVVTRYGHGRPTRAIRVIEAGHPMPDEAGADAAREMLELARSLDHEDLLVVLVSGGASALMTCPSDGLPMDDVRALNRELLRSGAPITEMNIVRKHLSAIAGGRLAAASAAPVVCFIISDVTGDDPSTIGSGPCAPDASSFADAAAILARYGIVPPASIRQHLAFGQADPRRETPKPGDALFARVHNQILVTPHASLEAAARWFRARGINAAILGDTVTGEAREAARVYAALAREIRRYNAPFAAPVALISGGECTVTIAPHNSGGRGGRCTEFLLSLALELDGLPDVYAMAGDTDGIDGSEDNAGAIVTPDTLARAKAAGLDAAAILARNDAWSLFHATGDLVVTGPTRTNVNDYRVILIC